MAKRNRRTLPETTRSEKAYVTLKRAIISGDLKEGMFLSPEDVEQKYKLGRTPFREACNRLHFERLIEVIPRRGFRVTEIGLREVRDLLELRLIFEGMIAELAASRATPDQVAELEKLAEGGMDAPEGGVDFELAVRLNKDFHLCVGAMTQNLELVKLQRALLERSERLSYEQFKNREIPGSEIRNLHLPIVEAIRQGDGVAARNALRADIRQGQNDLFGPAPNLAP